MSRGNLDKSSPDSKSNSSYPVTSVEEVLDTSFGGSISYPQDIRIKLSKQIASEIIKELQSLLDFQDMNLVDIDDVITNRINQLKELETTNA